MRWLLDKPFEFVVPLSSEECERRLIKKSRRGSDFFASSRAIFVKKVPHDTGFSLRMERDVGRNLSAEVWVSLVRQDAETTHVSGYGRFPLVNFVFLTFMLIFWSYIAYTFQSILVVAISLLPMSFSYIILRNRNDLIKVVYETLQA